MANNKPNLSRSFWIVFAVLAIIVLGTISIAARMTANDTGQIEAEVDTTSNTNPSKNPVETTFARLSEAPFEQPLPEELGLVVLTAVETDEGSVVELIDPSLTDAGAGTGLVATYLLYSPDIDPDAKFRGAVEGLSEERTQPTTLQTAERTTCILRRAAARCVTGSDSYLVQTSI